MSDIEKENLKSEEKDAIIGMSALLMDLANEAVDEINYPAKVATASHALNVLIRCYFEQ